MINVNIESNYGVTADHISRLRALDIRDIDRYQSSRNYGEVDLLHEFNRYFPQLLLGEVSLDINVRVQDAIDSALGLVLDVTVLDSNGDDIDLISVGIVMP